MSWDYDFSVDFEQRTEPARFFHSIVSLFSDSDLFGDLFSLRVYHKLKRQLYDGEMQLCTVEDHHVDSGSTQDAINQVVETLPDKYPGEDYLIEGWWRVQRYFWDNLDEAQSYSVTLNIKGEHFESPSTSFVTYSANNAKYFNGQMNREVASKNMELLVQELKVIIELEPRSIRGLDVDQSNDPRKHSLCYHATPQGFVEDLHTIGYRSPLLVNQDVLMAAAKQDQDVVFLKHQAAAIIYSQLGSRGNLGKFYEALRDIPGNQSGKNKEQ